MMARAGRRQEDHDVAHLARNRETEQVAVEGQRSIQVAHLENHVADTERFQHGPMIAACYPTPRSAGPGSAFTDSFSAGCVSAGRGQAFTEISAPAWPAGGSRAAYALIGARNSGRFPRGRGFGSASTDTSALMTLGGAQARRSGQQLAEISVEACAGHVEHARGPVGPDRERNLTRRVQGRPSSTRQAGHGAYPRAAWRRSATAICSSRVASCG